MLAAFAVVIFVVIFSIIIPLWPSSDRMQLTFPINSKDIKQIGELIKDKRLRSSIEEYPASLEIIKDENFNAYINVLLDQYKYSDKSMHDYIARMQFTEQGQQLFRSISVGWYNHFSITLIAHKKYDGYYKIIISKLSKEVTVSLSSRILSPLQSVFGMTIDEQKQMEAILTGVNQEQNKQTMENMMMYIMADNLRNRFNNDIKINLIG